MTAHNDLVYVQHIFDAIKKTISYTARLTEAEFMANSMVQDAVVRQFKIVGEAAKKISGSFREQHKLLPWSYMAKMRDVLIHHYWDVDLHVVWTTVRRDLPSLLPLIEELLAEG